VPVTARSGPESSISSYDIACVSREGANASASVVFYGDNAFFTAIAQEGAVENMDIAMDSRDRLVSYLSQSGL